MLTKEDIEKAMKKATVGHRGKWEVVRMLKDPEHYRERLYKDLLTGEYVSNIHYKEMEKTGKNGKTRHLMSPSLYTRVLQIAWCSAVQPYYEEVTIENQCGYIFSGSTNQLKYIENYEH